MRDESADDARNDPAEEHPQPEKSVDEAQYGIGDEVGDDAGGSVGFVGEEPAEVGMDHALDDSADRAVVEVGGMGVAFAVAVLVVLAVDGAPFKNGALAG